MALPKLKLDLDGSAYSVQLGEQAASVAVEQGPARRRRAHLGAISVAEVRWVLEAPQYQYLTAFRRTLLADATLPFLMDLILDDAPMAEYRCAFTIGSYRLEGKRGEAYIVSAQLEVRPNPVNRAYDMSILALGDAYGFDGTDRAMLAELSHLVNDILPAEFAA